MSEHPESIDLALEPEDNERLVNLCGHLDEHLRQIERRLGIEINNRGHRFRIIGETTSREGSRARTFPTVTASSPVPSHAFEMTPVRTQRLRPMSWRRVLRRSR